METVDDSFAYVLYVDEAGDDGLKSLRPENPSGSSEWICLAGYLVRAENVPVLPEALRSIRIEIAATQGPALHYRTLSPTKRLKACELVGRQSARAFVICSYKRTLLGYRNDRAAARSETNQWLYNFLIRMLLERVTDFCLTDSLTRHGRPRTVRIVFSARGGQRYGQTKATIHKLKAQATAGTTFLNKREIRPEVLRHRLIEYVPHYSEAGLQLADVVASAAFQAVETNSAAWDTAPAKALRPIMAMAPPVVEGPPTAMDFGFVLVPSVWKAKLVGAQQEIFQHYGYQFS